MDSPYQKYKAINPNITLHIQYEVLLSNEFRSLSKHAKTIYIAFLYKRRIPKGQSKKPKRVTNNGELEFDQDEAKQKWGISSATYWRAIRELKELKIIEVAKQGNSLEHTVNQYRLLGKFDGVIQPERFRHT